MPPLVIATAHLLSSPSTLRMAAIRLCVGCAAEIYVFATRGPAAAQVLRDRIALIEAASPALDGAKAVAALDVGWVGSATDAQIIDLAGATDPEIAALPGGHTSKALSGSFVLQRGADRIVLQLAPSSQKVPIAFARAIEARLFYDEVVQRYYRATEWHSPATLPIRYLILTRFDPPPR